MTANLTNDIKEIQLLARRIGIDILQFANYADENDADGATYNLNQVRASLNKLTEITGI